MKRLLAALIVILPLTFLGCDQPPAISLVQPHTNAQIEQPAVNLPYGLRQENWLGPRRTGSCVHASFIMLLRWQGQYELANWWRKNHGDGEYAERLAYKMDQAGVDYAYTQGSGDVQFLEWACSTRRGAGVVCMGGRHMICLVGLTDEHALLLDNNYIEVIYAVPREEFLTEWRASGSWAITPLVGPPAAPLPVRLSQ